jgi:hypothetical protein
MIISEDSSSGKSDIVNCQRLLQWRVQYISDDPPSSGSNK